jgi:hypothetical protein
MRLRAQTGESMLLCLTALTVTLALGGGALAAGSSVTLKAKGERSKSLRRACGKTKTFRIFGRHSTIEFKGVVTPHPAKHFPIRIEIKRCTHGHWSRALKFHVVGKKATGKFKEFVSASRLAPHSHKRRAITYYYGRAILAGGKSHKVYFAVTG